MVRRTAQAALAVVLAISMVPVVPSVSALAFDGDAVKQFSVAGYVSSVLTENDSLWMWGGNWEGQLGDGTMVDRATPVKVMDDVVQVSIGGTYSAAITSDASLWMWGNNDNGRLGDGTTISRTSPVKVLDDVAMVSVRWFHTLAVKRDGTLWAWGANGSGQLGDGTKTDRYSPVKVMDGVSSACSAGNHSVILKKDGSVWVCGYNIEGNLGSGSSNVIEMRPVKSMDNVAQIDSLGAVKNDGTLWTWGPNDHGRLGNSSSVSYSSVPVKVMEDVAEFSYGNEHAAAIKTDGSLWTWGCNEDGRLGDGTTTDRNRPVKVAEGVASVCAGFHSTTILKENGSLWACGGRAYLDAVGDGDSSVLREIPLSLFVDQHKRMENALVSLSKITFVCNGRVQKPSVAVTLAGSMLAKNTTSQTDAVSVSYSGNCTDVGTYTITVRGRGRYSGTVTRTFTILPGNTRLSSARGLRPSGRSGVLQARWGAAAGAGGYEVQVSASRGFSGKSTRTKRFSVSSKAGKRRSFKGAGLKRGKRYYVRVRAYKKAGKTTYYGAWSAAKSTKTRKR